MLLLCDPCGVDTASKNIAEAEAATAASEDEDVVVGNRMKRIVRGYQPSRRPWMVLISIGQEEEGGDGGRQKQQCGGKHQ